MIGGVGFEEGEELLEGGTLGARSDEAEHHVYGQGRNHLVLVITSFRQ